jgi:hypothetical protein
MTVINSIKPVILIIYGILTIMNILYSKKKLHLILKKLMNKGRRANDKLSPIRNSKISE